MEKRCHAAQLAILHRNLDDAFLRRFKAEVYFPRPRAKQRQRPWREGFSPQAHVKADHERIAREHDLTGGAIINVISKISLAAIALGEQATGPGESAAEGAADSRESPISQGDIKEAIRSEISKNC